MCTKADLDNLRAEFMATLDKTKQEIIDAICKKMNPTDLLTHK
jgi:hypothetical protein